MHFVAVVSGLPGHHVSHRGRCCCIQSRRSSTKRSGIILRKAMPHTPLSPALRVFGLSVDG